MTEILRFEMNLPTQVALESPQGVVVEGRYGNRMMFSLVDGRVMYVPPIVGSRIFHLGIRPGERFQVCKLEKREGQRKLIEWQVQRLLSEPETELEHKLRESIEIAQAAKGTQPTEASTDPAPQPPPPAPEQEPAVTHISGATAAVAPAANGSSNGTTSSAARNGNGQPASTTKLEHALKTAISAAHNAEKYGAELGYVVRFDADAIKSMAITVLINMSEGGRR
jgi:hypothetical protein